MVKKYHTRNSSIKQTLSRSGHAKQQEVQQTTHQIQVAEEQRVHDNGVEMRATVHRRRGRVIEEVIAKMSQGIMQSASESESDDDDEERGTRMRPRSPRPA